MKKCFYVLAVAIFALAGCAKEVAKNEVPVKDGKMIFNAVIEAPAMDDETKASLGRDGVFAWAGNESVAFFTEDGTKVEGTVSTNGATIEVASGEYVSAIYPVAAATAKNQVSFNNLPAGQPVIVAKVSGANLEFYHIGSLINIKIANAPLNSNIEITPSATTGDGSFSFDGEGVPSLTPGSTTVSASAVDATAEQLANGVSISIPNANYLSGFKVNVKTKAGYIYFKKSTTRDFDLSARGKLLNMKEFSIPTYTVAGGGGTIGYIFKDSWAPTSAFNDMVLQSDGLYKKEFAVPAPGGTGFKVTENHSWDEAWPDEDMEVNISENDAPCVMTVIYNPITNAVNYTTSKDGINNPNLFYTVYVKDNTNWGGTDRYLYSWNPDDDKPYCELWPGFKSTGTTNEGYYMFKLPVLLYKDKELNFIFDKTTGIQINSIAITLSESNNAPTLSVYDNGFGFTIAITKVLEASDFVVAGDSNNKFWIAVEGNAWKDPNPNTYDWGNNSQHYGTWPGAPMTKYKEIGGLDWYYINVDHGIIDEVEKIFNKIIFNYYKGGQTVAETVSIPISDDTKDYYYIIQNKDKGDYFTVEL